MNFNFEMGGPVSLGMPMRLPEFQMMYSLNPNNRIGTAADNLNSSGGVMFWNIEFEVVISELLCGKRGGYPGSKGQQPRTDTL